MDIHLSSPRLLLSLLFLGLLFSCIKEEFDPEKLDTEIIINPGVAAPLGFIHYELEELLKDSLHPEEMIVDNDGFISMVYEEEILSFQASEFLQLSVSPLSGSIDNNYPFQLDLSLVDTLSKSDTTYFTLTGSDGPDETEIDSIKLDSMTIVINLSTSYNLEGIMQIHSPGITKNGEHWTARIGLSRPVQSFKLEGYTVILSNDPPDINRIPIIYTMILNGSSGTVPPLSPILDYTFEVSKLDFSVIYGYLGNMNIRINPQTIPISFFNSIIDGTFYFAEPSLNLYFENSFGIPIRIIMNDLYVISREGNLIDITGDSVPSAEQMRIIHYPSLHEAGNTAYDSIILNQDNTNLDLALQSSPRSFIFGVEAETNPSGEMTKNNFITDRSQYGVKAKLILPLYGYADFMLMIDTLKFDFEDFFQNPPEEIKRLAFRLNFTNSFPVNVYVQMYFLNENYVVIDSVFNERRLVEAGMDTNGDGKIDPVQNNPIEVEFTRTKIDNISDARHIAINGRFNTTNIELPEMFKFYSHYFIDGYIGVVGNIELNSTGN